MKKPLLLAAFGLALTGCPQTSCVARGSRVLTPDGWRVIESLAVGDLVFCVNEDTGERFATPIVAVKSAMREVGLLEVAGVALQLTSDHPVYCPRDEVYAPAGDWFLGRRTALAMASESGLEQREVERVSTFVEVTEVFDITVEHDLHNFVAEGVLVHNKSIVDPAYDMFHDANSADVSTDTAATDTSNPSDTSIPDTGSDSGSDAGTDVGTDAGMPRHRGSCMTTADCANPDWECITIPANDPAGYHTCQPAAAAEPGCATIEAPDTCCLHTDCNQADPSGTCITGPIFYCGGVAPMIANVCVADACGTDGDCGVGEMCLPARVLGEPVSRCVATRCQLDAECVGGTGGECSPFFNPCNGRFSGFACTYDDSACRSNADCTDGNLRYCQAGAGDGDTACVEFQPPP